MLLPGLQRVTCHATARDMSRTDVRMHTRALRTQAHNRHEERFAESENNMALGTRDLVLLSLYYFFVCVNEADSRCELYRMLPTHCSPSSLHTSVPVSRHARVPFSRPCLSLALSREVTRNAGPWPEWRAELASARRRFHAVWTLEREKEREREREAGRTRGRERRHRVPVRNTLRTCDMLRMLRVSCSATRGRLHIALRHLPSRRRAYKWSLFLLRSNTIAHPPSRLPR